MRHVQLRAFHNVAIHGGFSKAADALSLTQPAISDQVSRLEEHYDVILFNRHKRQVTLTEFGKSLLEITRKLFEIERQASDLLLESQALRSGTLRIVADSPRHLLHIFGAFRKKYPGITVSLHSANSKEVVAKLFNYEADIGVLGEIPANREFSTVKLNSTPITAFAAKNFPLDNKTHQTIAKLAEMPLVLREKGSLTRRILENMAKKQGIKLQATIEAEGREAVREIVASGAGIGFVSKAEFGHDDRLVEIPLTGDIMLMDEALICLKERSNAKLIKVFMAMAETHSTADEAQNEINH